MFGLWIRDWTRFWIGSKINLIWFEMHWFHFYLSNVIFRSNRCRRNQGGKWFHGWLLNNLLYLQYIAHSSKILRIYICNFKILDLISNSNFKEKIPYWSCFGRVLKTDIVRIHSSTWSQGLNFAVSTAFRDKRIVRFRFTTVTCSCYGDMVPRIILIIFKQ